jgi:hypothetical protein
MSDLHWTTGITSIQPNEVRLRGYRIDELMGRVTFGQAVYLALKGELPSPEVGQLMDAMLVSSIDHGATPPSALAAHTVASTGATLNAGIAAGVLAINRFHGGAIEGCMRLLLDSIERLDGDNSPDEVVAQVLTQRGWGIGGAAGGPGLSTRAGQRLLYHRSRHRPGGSHARRDDPPTSNATYPSDRSRVRRTSAQGTDMRVRDWATRPVRKLTSWRVSGR